MSINIVQHQHHQQQHETYLSAPNLEHHAWKWVRLKDSWSEFIMNNENIKGPSLAIL
ncbi:predicted protein [Botrytis cinerea T4]|uniref:Uncharacterized protein n=1 Tax=Botryotinia fuckeliana (strain T4) TaxID=999810 RepID=G2Y4R0_BOTF4|nr:predicted protein [Botrytis cinerea T4]